VERVFSGRISKKEVKEHHFRCFLEGSGLGIRGTYNGMQATTNPLGKENRMFLVAGSVRSNEFLLKKSWHAICVLKGSEACLVNSGDLYDYCID
jgi:aldehyde:ferredoxin oxidoreductase